LASDNFDYMAYAEHIDKALWDQRLKWLEATEEREAGNWGSILLSPQGTFLTYDIQAAFCAGAWISVIVLSHAAIDATIRDTELGDYKINSKQLFGGNSDLEWLRTLRNRLVHVSDPEGKQSYFSEKELEDIATFHDGLEEEAKRAVTLVFRIIYANPGT
jgi:hypothetical protein